MKIASWNVNSLNVRLPHVSAWLDSRRPDVIGLQETKLEDHKFPDAELAALGYRSVFAGQKTYNGVALLSRESAQAVQVGVPGLDDDQKRAIAASFGDLRVINLYVVNGKAVGDEKYDYKLRWLQAVHEWIAVERARYPNLIVLGDFNIAPDDRDVHDPQAWKDQILCSVPERAALTGLLDQGLHDSFRLFSADAGQFSWWDYRQADSAAISVCESIWSWCLRRSSRAAVRRSLIVSRAPGNGLPTTRRCGSSWTELLHRFSINACPWIFHVDNS